MTPGARESDFERSWLPTATPANASMLHEIAGGAPLSAGPSTAYYRAAVTHGIVGSAQGVNGRARGNDREHKGTADSIIVYESRREDHLFEICSGPLSIHPTMAGVRLVYAMQFT